MNPAHLGWPGSEGICGTGYDLAKANEKEFPRLAVNSPTSWILIPFAYRTTLFPSFRKPSSPHKVDVLYDRDHSTELPRFEGHNDVGGIPS